MENRQEVKGTHYRKEGAQMKVVPKGGTAPGNTKTPYHKKGSK